MRSHVRDGTHYGIVLSIQIGYVECSLSGCGSGRGQDLPARRVELVYYDV